MTKQPLSALELGLIAVLIVLLGAAGVVLFTGGGEDDDAPAEDQIRTLSVQEAVTALRRDEVVRINLDEDEGGGAPTVTLYFNTGDPPAVLEDPPPSQEQNFLAYLQANGARPGDLIGIETTFEEND
jgi:hypothetical protein